MSEEEKRRQTEKLFNSHPNRYSVDRVSSFLDAQLDGEPEMDIKEKEIKTKEERLMYAAGLKWINLYRFDAKQVKLLMVLWLLFLERMGYADPVHL